MNNPLRPKKFEVFVDGGVRRATDVMKAIALGATAVGIGRPTIYAMSTYGQEGVSKMFQILKVSLLRQSLRMSARRMDLLTVTRTSLK